MRTAVEEEIEIAKPCAEVAAFAGNPSTAPEWCDHVVAVRWWTEPPVRVGARVTFVVRVLGQRLVYPAEVDQFVPGERLVMRTALGPVPIETTYIWRAVTTGSTRMTVRKQARPRGLARLGVPVLAAAMRWMMYEDLAQLKRLLESG